MRKRAIALHRFSSQASTLIFFPSYIFCFADTSLRRRGRPWYAATA
jgi:hypothetical protein